MLPTKQMVNTAMEYKLILQRWWNLQATFGTDDWHFLLEIMWGEAVLMHSASNGIPECIDKTFNLPRTKLGVLILEYLPGIPKWLLSGMLIVKTWPQTRLQIQDVINRLLRLVKFIDHDSYSLDCMEMSNNPGVVMKVFCLTETLKRKVIDLVGVFVCI